MTTQFTPGPWRFAGTGETMQSYSQPYGIADNKAQTLIAGVFGDVKGGEKVAHANAALIASAPALYEALKAIEALFSIEHRSKPQSIRVKREADALNAARAALSQAEGK